MQVAVKETATVTLGRHSAHGDVVSREGELVTVQFGKAPGNMLTGRLVQAV